jgi:hypothetical protein
MARTMFDEYKTSDQFWAEAINMTRHVTNCLYLHKLLKKTSYELLIGNKSNVFYFQVFGSKCYVLQKRSKSSKFAPKIYEVFLLGYDSNSHAYRVFNVTTGCVETLCNVVFDETNYSQKEQVNLDVVDDEKAPCDALRRMDIGDVRPQDPSNQPQEIIPNDTTHPHKDLIKMNMKIKMNTKIKSKRRGMIKGEMRMMGIREKDHHIQECTIMFKEITPSTTYLVTLKNG